jgi:NAD-dependent dihydropyrimidine dehydrogenase PreA subunit
LMAASSCGQSFVTRISTSITISGTPLEVILDLERREGGNLWHVAEFGDRARLLGRGWLKTHARGVGSRRGRPVAASVPRGGLTFVISPVGGIEAIHRRVTLLERAVSLGLATGRLDRCARRLPILGGRAVPAGEDGCMGICAACAS